MYLNLYFYSTQGEVDVVSVPVVAKRSYDTERAQKLMEECDRHCNFANPEVKTLEEDEEWEEKIAK